MEQVAIDQGVGEHYIYDANQLHSRDRGIFGHAASQQAGALGASRFEPAPWLKPQYISLIHASSYSPGGVPMYTVRNVKLAPDYHHGRSVISRLLWGHHPPGAPGGHGQAHMTRQPLEQRLPARARSSLLITLSRVIGQSTKRPFSASAEAW